MADRRRANAGSWTKGDPRASAAGRHAWKSRKRQTWRTLDYIKGYTAGYRNAKRHLQQWIADQKDIA